MGHKNSKEITCPYCRESLRDSWEIDGDDGELECSACEKTFSFEKHIQVTYSTSKMACKEGEHNYKTDSYHIFKRIPDYSTSPITWKDAPESEWEYSRKEVFSLCEDYEYIKISKKEYELASQIVKI